jgi:hypothetical protein
VRGSERHAIIAADVGGPAALAKKPFKHSKSVVFFGGGKSRTAKKKTAGVVGDRQWITILTISEQELSFVVGAPDFHPLE